MYRQHYGQGHRWCQGCRHVVDPRFGGCRTCRTPLAQLMMYDELYDGGYFGGEFSGPVGFDPFDGEFAFDIGGGLAVEPDGQLDIETPFGDIPVDDIW